MKYLMIATVGVCLLFAAVPAMTQSAADEAAIREASKQARELLNNGDLKAHLDLYADPFLGFGGTNDRAAHEKLHQDAMARSKDNPAHSEMLDEIGVFFLTPDIAIHQFQVQWNGGIDEDGNAMPPAKQDAARIYMKKNGKWLLKAAYSRLIEE